MTEKILKPSVRVITVGWCLTDNTEPSRATWRLVSFRGCHDMDQTVEREAPGSDSDPAHSRTDNAFHRTYR